MRSDTRAVLQALQSHFKRNAFISGPELTAAAGFDHPDSAPRLLRKSVALGILIADGQGSARRWSWADPVLARLSDDELGAEFERRDAASKRLQGPHKGRIDK